MALAPAPNYVISQLAFTDCDSSPAVSVYRGISSGDTVLPSLFAFQVYVTYEIPLASNRDIVAHRFLERVLVDFGDSDLVRVDVYFRPRASTADILSHYAIQGRALDTYATDSNYFHGLAVVVGSEQWERDGVHLLFHHLPDGLLTSDQKKEIYGDDITDLGSLLVHVPALDGPSGLSLRLRQVAENSPDWRNFHEEYRTAIRQGKTHWGLSLISPE
ncbi:hypothetical protein F5Y12DRAFT_197491 [Xylaria sp. FL1777]|nr:hypothetical protein F5Y12DRAFT_197491 [Xylaria sp. FL1777]